MNLIYNPKSVNLTEIVALDLETSGLNPVVDKVRLIIIHTEQGDCYILDPSKYSTKFLVELCESLNKCEVVIAHNAKFDCGFLFSNYGVLLRNMFCTMIGSQILTNGQELEDGGHGLAEVIKRYLNKSLTYGLERDQKSKKTHKSLAQLSFTNKYFIGEFTAKQLAYASDDVRYLFALYHVQKTKLVSMELHKIEELEMLLLPILAKMEVEGCTIDAKGWRELIVNSWVPELDAIEKRLDDEVLRLSREFPELTGKYTRPRQKQRVYVLDLFGGVEEQCNTNEGNINYASPTQILEIFQILNLPLPLAGDKASVDETTLTTYVNENPKSPLYKFIQILIEYRELAKLISTYGEKFLAQLDKNSKIHTQYTQTYTTTGRLSSKAPNLQNIPKPVNAKDPRNIRKFFVASPGHKLVTCDMESAEIRIAADYSQEPLLLKSILEGADMHSEVATTTFSIIFGKHTPISKSHEPFEVGGYTFVPEELRDKHKRLIFAKFYKAGAKRVYNVAAEFINLFYEGEERMQIAQKISDAVDKKMPKLMKYLSGLIKEAHTKGYLRGSKLGRVRFFNEDAYGECANYPIQNTNAEALKIALINIDKYFRTTGHGRIVMNIHDEVVCEIPDEHVEVAAKEVKEIMAKALSWFLTTIKGGATIKINDHWEK